jgi:drug/metabolite transporter (DMT)-like permease
LSLKGERAGLAWFFGTCGFAGFGFLVFLGQQMAGETGALTASITMATMPLLGLLVNWLVRGAKPPFLTLCFILLSFSGVALVITEGHFDKLFASPHDFIANVPILLGALCWVIYTIGGSFFPKWSPYRYTAITTVLGLTSVFAVNAVLMAIGYIELPHAAQVASVAPHLLYMAMVAGLVAVLCWNAGNKILTPVNGVLFMDVVPITAFSVSSLMGVVPGHAQVIGAAITATALVINNLYQRHRMAAAANAPQVKPAKAVIGAQAARAN